MSYRIREVPIELKMERHYAGQNNPYYKFVVSSGDTELSTGDTLQEAIEGCNYLSEDDKAELFKQFDEEDN